MWTDLYYYVSHSSIDQINIIKMNYALQCLVLEYCDLSGIMP